MKLKNVRTYRERIRENYNKVSKENHEWQNLREGLGENETISYVGQELDWQEQSKEK